MVLPRNIFTSQTTMKVVLKMPFLTFNNIDIQFAEKELTWSFYIAKKTLSTTWRVKLINKKEFTKAALVKNIKAFVVHVSFLNLRSKMTIHSAQEAQIALLLAKKVTVPTEYADFSDVFLKKSAKVLLECTRINGYIIKLEDGKQSPYGPIYSLGTVEFKTLKTYIKTNLSNSFI